MSGQALGLVLFAAVLHASWNAMVRGGSDRALTLAGVAMAHGILGAVFIALSPPPAPESWPWLALSAVVHYVYYWLLFRAYREGDLSQVYPISRGMSPALVTLGVMVLIGETLTPAGFAGVALVSCGIGLLAFSARGRARAPLWFAVALGIMIAIYSVADGIGVRASNALLGYMGWLFLSEALIPAVVLGRRLRQRQRLDPRVLALGLLGGVFSVAAYGIALYVKTIAPIGAVSAVRESSVIIAALIGVFLFGERPAGLRLVAAGVVAIGVAALAIGG
ncbi:EamA family transporter [Szabonella alba]|uniref:EamA family transporter n=1 Tax=Szabonella alba TaxID=2804194 RepID=A0A8K0VCF0_9RHOB|nr:EamA family transporter [Szabonella alba]MBL4918456.1 EamA family transporter [Szabonella alba]